MIIVHDTPTFRNTLLWQVDNKADKLRLLVVGDPVRVAEYQVTETEARAFKASGYADPAPPTVVSWAEAKNWTNTQAADDILAAAASWNAALYAIRDIRLKSKEAIKSATTAVVANQIMANFDSQIAAITAQLGL
jgi:DNA-binding transcriptional regulator LsrR (DeoR family)